MASTRSVMLALLLVTGCSMPDATELACDDFAAHARDGLPAAERVKTAQSVGEVVGNADQRVRDAHAGLVRTADGSDSSYRLAADTFAQSCFDAGWDG